MTNHKQQSSNDQTPSRIHIQMYLAYEFRSSECKANDCPIKEWGWANNGFFFFSFYAYMYTVHTVQYTTVHSKHITHITCCCLPEFAFAIDWMCQVSTCANALACVCVCAKSNKISTHNHCKYMFTQLYIEAHVSQWIYMNCQYALLLLRTNKQTLRLCAHAVGMCACILCMCGLFCLSRCAMSNNFLFYCLFAYVLPFVESTPPYTFISAWLECEQAHRQRLVHFKLSERAHILGVQLAICILWFIRPLRSIVTFTVKLSESNANLLSTSSKCVLLDFRVKRKNHSNFQEIW